MWEHEEERENAAVVTRRQIITINLIDQSFPIGFDIPRYD